MNLAISIPTYNRKEALELLLNSIFREIEEIQTNFEINIFLFDNYSTDGTEDLIKGIKNIYNIHYYKNEMNYGAGINITKAMFMPTSDYLLLLPDDAILEKKSLKRIIDVIQNQQPDIIALNRFDNFGDKTYSDIGNFFNEHFNKITWMGGFVYNQKSFRNKNFCRVSTSWFPHIEYIFNNKENVKKIIYLKNDIVRKNEDIPDCYLPIDHWYNIIKYLNYINYEYGVKIKCNAYKKFFDMIEIKLINAINNKSYYMENQNKIDSIINKYVTYSISSYIKMLKRKLIVKIFKK